MPRAARLDAPGVLHHIIIRGIERRQIFRDDQDREDFLARLATVVRETGIACYAWALLPNHAHFLLRTGRVPIATGMRRLLIGYVVRFNRRHNRVGHLLHNRYKSIVCQEEVYLQELVRYIHLNPLRAGLVPSVAKLNTYAYCGHSALLGKRLRPWQDVSYVLQVFGTRPAVARRAYLAYVEAGSSQGHRRDLVGGGLIRSLGGWTEARRQLAARADHVKSDERILGESDFVDAILAQANEHYTHRYELGRRGYDLDRVAERAAILHHLEPRELFVRGRQRSRVDARSLFCYWAVQELGVALTELARRLSLSPPAIGYAVRRGERIAQACGYRLIP
jgi:REP element-mobilizing transposase RayT